MHSILLVDDNQEIRQIIESALAFHGDFEVHQASDGEEAIELLTELGTVDVVVLDLQMPVTNGWETLRVIRDPENGWPEVKVIMLTVQKEAENALKAWTIGANFFVAKPFKVKTILDTLDKALATSV